MLSGIDSPILWAALGTITGVIVVSALLWIGFPYREIIDRLQERFVLGVPWGTLIVLTGLVFVYLFIQRGWWHWHSPVVVAYTAVSMWDPTGWMLAGFSHSSPSHLRGNLTTAIVFAPIVEWIWGHYPTAKDGYGSSRLRDPRIRACVLFPLGIGAIGVLATLLSWGPVIGFSVAAYALIGIVLVHFPVIAIIGLVVRAVVRLFWRAMTDPVQISRATVRVVEPSWFGSAVQGHLVGLLLGVLVGLWLLNRSNAVRPPPGRLFAATALIGTYLSLWTVWWILGEDQFILFRAAGVLVVLAIATVVMLAGASRNTIDFSIDRIAMGVILVAVISMGVVGVGLNFATAEAPEGSADYRVADYDIYYAENVPDGMVNIVDIEALGLTTDVRTSGVIVVSEDRNVWRRTISRTELETHGDRSFHVGGIGWSEQIVAERTGWIPAGARPVYEVRIGTGDASELAHTSQDQTARVLVANHSFSMSVEEEGFYVNVHHNNSVERVIVPEHNQTVEIQEVELLRYGDELIVFADDTVVPIATRETYQ